MILVDFECILAHRTEHIVDSDVHSLVCPLCGEVAYRIISYGSAYRREDAPWLETVKEVVDKDSKDPATRRFLAEPTRANREAWMKERGIRPYEPGDKPDKSEPDTARTAERLMHRHYERKAITIR